MSELCKTYSWGELYDTLKEMEAKGDSHQDPLFTRVFQLFEALDAAKTLAEIKKLVKNCKLTEFEINRINSSCLDGIIKSIFISHKPLKFLLHTSSKYVESCKFYISKLPLEKYPMFFNIACVNNRIEIIKYMSEYVPNCNKYIIEYGCKINSISLIELGFLEGYKFSDTELKFISRQCKLPIVKFVILNQTLQLNHYLLFLSQACILGQIETVKFLVENEHKFCPVLRLPPTPELHTETDIFGCMYIALIYCSKNKRYEIFEWLAEKDLNELNSIGVICLKNAIAGNDIFLTERLIEKYKVDPIYIPENWINIWLTDLKLALYLHKNFGRNGQFLQAIDTIRTKQWLAR